MKEYKTTRHADSVEDVMSESTQRRREWKFDLEDRLIRFASTILTLLTQLPVDRESEHIARQLLRSGTSAAPNYAEALGAESLRDFIHKLGIAVKELRETFVWIRLIKLRGLVADQKLLDDCIRECNELISILVASINTSRKNAKTHSKF
jgi:four helix bundle protein